MAFLAHNEVDGVVIEDDYDQVDGNSHTVIHVLRDSDIPSRYYRKKVFSHHPESPKNGERVQEKSARFRMVHCSWGSGEDHPVTSDHVLALLKVDSGKELNEESSQNVHHFIQKALRDHMCYVFRWDPCHLLVQLPSETARTALGQAFIDEKLDDIDGYKVESIEPSVLTNAPRCFFEIDTTDPGMMATTLNEILAPFASAFNYLVVRHVDANSSEVVADTLPALAVTLLFPGKHQGNANRTLSKLQHSPWRAVQLPESITKSLNNMINLFTNSNLSVPLIGIETGCPAVGIQLTVLVQDFINFDKMVDFYRRVTKTDPVKLNAEGSALRYCTFPLSRKAELVIAFYPDIKIGSLKNASVYIQVSSISHIDGLIRISEDHWHLNDPEGNRVVLFIPLK